MSTADATRLRGDGLCECGCGGRTRLAPKTRRIYGQVKGQPVRFIRGHGACKHPPEIALDPKRSKHEAMRAWWLKEKFGLTVADYNRMLDDQGGVCGICGRAETATHRGNVRRLSVDHDHATGTVRALLCNDCNTGLGKFGDDPVQLETAAAYLRRHAMDDHHTASAED